MYLCILGDPLTGGVLDSRHINTLYGKNVHFVAYQPSFVGR